MRKAGKSVFTNISALSLIPYPLSIKYAPLGAEYR